MQSVITIPVSRYETGGFLDVTDQVAVEEPLEIQLQYGPAGGRVSQAVSVTMRTPGHDAELGAGFLFTEGIIASRAQIESADESRAGENVLLVSLHEHALPVLQHASRNFYTTSSCGVCGKSSIDAITTVSAWMQQPDTVTVSPEVLHSLPGTLRRQQALFGATGGLHASALFLQDGSFITLREDVGRHNALDKVIGGSLLQDSLPLSGVLLLLSGRASFELVQKASMAGIRIIAAIGAPSSLAIQLAAEQGITLIGFLRDGRFNVYAHEHRIVP